MSITQFLYTTAHSLAKEQGKNFGDDIASAIRIAKRKVTSFHFNWMICHVDQCWSCCLFLQRWQIREEERLSKQSELQIFLTQLLEGHRQRYCAHLYYRAHMYIRLHVL